jgi:hypothetical protein
MCAKGGMNFYFDSFKGVGKTNSVFCRPNSSSEPPQRSPAESRPELKFKSLFRFESYPAH